MRTPLDHPNAKLMIALGLRYLGVLLTAVIIAGRFPRRTRGPLELPQTVESRKGA